MNSEYCDQEGPNTQNLWLSQSVLPVAQLHYCTTARAPREAPLELHDHGRVPAVVHERGVVHDVQAPCQGHLRA